MNKRLQAILDLLQQSGSLTPEEKKSLADAVKESDKEITITEFKLERTEKVKRTTAILLEETIAELEQKRKSVEAQNRELEIEAALERVRSSAMAMHNSNDISATTSIVFTELQKLGTQSIRCGVGLLSNDSHMAQVYAATTSSDGEFHTLMRTISMTEHSSLAQQYETWLKQENYQTVLKGEDLKSYYDLPFFHSSASYVPPEHYDQKEYGYYFPFPEGLFYAWTETPYSESELNILNRFKTIIALTFRRYLDLKKAEAQAKESQIQLALERVRARTMAMQRSEELTDTAALLFQQINELGIHQWGNSFQLWDDNMRAVTAWTCTQGLDVQKFQIPTTEDPVMINIVNAAQKGEILHVEEMGGEALEDHYKFMYSLPVFKKILDNLAATGISPPKFQVMYAAYFSSGYILFITHEPNPEAHDIFKRFAKVFEQTYTRFLDLKKAEAQSRESQIQLALERVRARTMAMQKSDELKDVAHELRVQLAELGTTELETCAINLYEEHDEFLEAWVAVRAPDSPKDISEFHFLLPKKGIYIIEDMLQAYTSDVEEFVFELGGTKGVQWMNTMETLVPEMFAVAAAAPDFKNTGTVQAWFCCQYFAGGALIMITMTPPLAEARLLMRRCTQVFSLAYRRFADLKKAEAQAREAQIEAALERVRSRSMSMQKSKELKEVIRVVYEQFVHLSIVIEHTGFIMDYKTRDDMNIWLADQHEVPSQVTIPYFDSPHWKSFKEAKDKGQDFFANKLNFEEKNRFYQKLFEFIPDLQEESKEYYLSCSGLAISTVLLDNVGLYIENFSGLPYSDEENATLMRFGKVFQQTYTRFLDLQKAEAQAKEAQVEAALEKVRSRSLAMHKAEELGEVITVVFDKLKDLNFSVGDGVALITFIEGSRDLNEWMANPGFSSATRFYLPYFEHPVLSNLWNAKNQGVEFLEGRYTAEENRSFLNHIFEYTDYKHTPQEIKDSCLAADFYNNSIVFQKNTAIFINDYTGHSLSEHEIDILKRVSKVFEQTYTRFLDLQKAEEQTRLAQIEVSLERVRARAMGMHHSDELSDVLSVLFDQFDVLGIQPVYTFLSLIDLHKNKFTYRQTGKGGQRVIAQQVIDLDKMEEWKDLFESMRAGRIDPINCIHYPKESLEKVWEVFDEIYSALPEGSKVYPEDFPDGVYTTQAYCKFGYLGFDHTRPASAEDKDILQRFANEFARLYQRFLDLQKAEAQAREAQIEAALEKVRSRTLAMHTPHELGEVVLVIVEKLKELGVVLDANGVILCTYFQNSKNVLHWIASPDFSFAGSYLLPYFDHPIFKDAWESKMSGADYFSKSFSVEEKDSFFEYAFEHSDYKYFPDEFKQWVFQNDKHSLSFAWQKNSAILIPSHTGIVPGEGQKEILKRFSKVFEQAYIRFLDLQKAEAQAREAQIEAGLERVRSRAMAMQTSEELNALIGTVFTELTKLDLVLTRCVIMTYDHKTNDARWWMANSEAPEQPMNFHVQYHEHPPNLAYFSAWREQRVKWIYTLEGNVKKDWDDFIFSETELRLLPDFVIAGMKAPDRVYLNASFYNSGNLTLASLEPLSDEHFEILIRFAKVFDLTYTRFNDLKQAEAQAREAKIEAALERVRSRTMAMQRSEELVDVASILFQQVKALGAPQWNCGLNIWEIGDKEFTYYPGSPDGIISPSPCKIPLTEHPVFISFDDSRKRGDELFIYEKEGEFQADHYRYMLSLRPGVGDLLQSMLDAGFQLPTFQIDHVANFAYGNLIFITFEHFPEMHDVFKRFAKVFEQTYTRFLDLQKAEAQTREAQIEASLERVRSKTMAMHNSQDVGDTVATLFDELTKLGVKTNRCGILVFGDSDVTEVWTAKSNPSGKANLIIGHLDVASHPMLTSARNTWKNKETSFSYEMVGDDLINYYQTISNQPDYRIQVNMDALPSKEIHTEFYFPEGAVFAFTPEAIEVGAAQIFKRLAGVFGQTYRRYLDLQKAEAQAREAQIEASLERVRSKSMAMHKSEEILEVIKTMCDQFTHLGFEFHVVNIGTDFRNREHDLNVWIYGKDAGNIYPHRVRIPYIDNALLFKIKESLEKGVEFFSVTLSKNEKDEFYQHLFSNTIVGSLIPDERKQFLLNEAIYSSSIYILKHTLIILINYDGLPFSEEHNVILKRFGNVLEQSYTRFMDLEKAEAQARESQIEAALERVRSRTMAMHRSEEIADIVGKIFKELTSLDVALNRVLIWIFNSDEKYFTWWSANPEAKSNAESYRVNYVDHPVFSTYFDAWEKKLPLLSFTLGDNLKVSWEDHLFKNTELSRIPKAVQDGMRSEKKIFTTSAIGDYGLLMAGCFEPFSDEVNDIIQRFGRVFQQSYTRYMDVQKAEDQAREATIEASLEKVRGKAMAMHNSNDLVSTASLVFTELRKLGIDSFRNGVGLLTKENRNVKLYSATSSEEGGSFSLVGWAVLDHHPVLSKTYDSWIDNKDYYPVLKGETLKSYYENILATFTVPAEQSEGYEQHGYFLPFSEGLFYGWSEKPYTETDIKILHRFRGIVDLTFRRYMELEKSESIAKEAIRQASLDRVRAEIASMRTTADLDRITPLIWKELNILNIPFVRCGVFIMDDFQQLIHTFLSTPEGEAIAAFHLPYEIPGNTGEILSHWRNKQMYISHWDETAFSDLGEQLVKQGAIPSKDVYMNTIPSGGIHLHCLPFLQGMLYVGNTMQLKEDDIHLIQSVADAFSTAYARYEDFNKLESAKVQIEKTLTDLKQTQTLLVQSEKMASLGELTAGIAHEIQNPLNFVNNFSEVSNELLEEMKEEIEKGNYDEVQAITNNIKQNLEKILHHGKRADGIVKGMLQHSRSSTGMTEPTDINALVDEYLRLAYHGFRAKDKSFNASTNTDLDKSIGKINVVPQDIGRVVLNLITNAFYAVTEKQNKTVAEYQPTVFLSTKRRDDCVLISVKDNGNGIPEQIREKIFQPFFTTKPTGQGTGLGLSLSYDIVKAHGGDLKVETTPGEGSEFVISIMDK